MLQAASCWCSCCLTLPASKDQNAMSSILNTVFESLDIQSEDTTHSQASMLQMQFLNAQGVKHIIL